MSSTETLEAGHSRRSLVSSPSEQKKKSILKKSESGSSRSGGGSVIVVGSGARSGMSDPERENLLMSDPESSAAETPVVSRKRLPISTSSSIDTSTVALPPTQLSCDVVKSLIGPKLRTSGTIVNRGMSLTSTADQNNHNNNGTANHSLNIKLVKLPDEERQRMAASNNVNNNVSTSLHHHQLPSVDFVTRGAPLTSYATSRSNGMASKEIQTSSANLTSAASHASSGGSATQAGGRKFERGRDPHRQRSPPARGDSIPMEGVVTSTATSSLPPPVPRCSNLNCRHNVPSAAASSSNKRIVCLCGNTMTMLSSEHQQQQQQQQQQHQTTLINLRPGEKPFIFVGSVPSEETKLVASNKLPDKISS